jgi:putative glutamine amidotransferase
VNPRIGLTGVTRAVSGVDRTGVNAAYVRSVIQAGGVPLILSPLLDEQHHAILLDQLDGLVFTGGEDVGPAHYGATPHPRLGDVDPVRDRFELGLFRASRASRLPVLAICRGIQLVNVALGGTLWQDLPSERPDALPHVQPTGRDQRTHPVEITPGSRLARALAATRLEVNSFHHQAIRTLASGLVVTATAPDGAIEGVESQDPDPWLLAVQWHPEEFHREGSAPERGLFGALVREAGEFAREQRARLGDAVHATAGTHPERGPARSGR